MEDRKYRELESSWETLCPKHYSEFEAERKRREIERRRVVLKEIDEVSGPA